MFISFLMNGISNLFQKLQMGWYSCKECKKVNVIVRQRFINYSGRVSSTEWYTYKKKNAVTVSY